MEEDFQQISSPRIKTPNTHGTGCTFSSAIAANLALEKDFFEAVTLAKTYITGAIEHALDIGRSEQNLSLDSVNGGGGQAPRHCALIVAPALPFSVVSVAVVQLGVVSVFIAALALTVALLVMLMFLVAVVAGRAAEWLGLAAGRAAVILRASPTRSATSCVGVCSPVLSLLSGAVFQQSVPAWLRLLGV